MPTAKVTPKLSLRSAGGVAPPPRLSEQIDRGHGGYLLAIAPALFGLVGWWLDSLLGWAPVLTILGATYGLVGALVKVIMSYRAEMALQGDARRTVRNTAEGSHRAAAAVESDQAAT
ncbi:MAG: AtpZ/AtpI family protein [Microthrixaceae bacterium]